MSEPMSLYRGETLDVLAENTTYKEVGDVDKGNAARRNRVPDVVKGVRTLKGNGTKGRVKERVGLNNEVS